MRCNINQMFWNKAFSKVIRPCLRKNTIYGQTNSIIIGVSMLVLQLFLTKIYIDPFEFFNSILTKQNKILFKIKKCKLQIKTYKSERGIWEFWIFPHWNALSFPKLEALLVQGPRSRTGWEGLKASPPPNNFLQKIKINQIKNNATKISEPKIAETREFEIGRDLQKESEWTWRALWGTSSAP